MNPRELVDYIHSGPEELNLDEPLRFRRRTRSNPCDFNEFLEALQSNETIRTVMCKYHEALGILEDEWVLLVKRLGSIKGIQSLTFNVTPGSSRFRPFQAVAEAVSNAHSLQKLDFGLQEEICFSDPSGLIALANSLREHPALQEFNWFDFCSYDQLEAAQIATFDPVLRALSTCTHLRMVYIIAAYASADAIKNLLHLQSATELHLILETEQWLAVADEIQQGRCNVRVLHLTMLECPMSEATEAVQKIANAIRFDSNLDYLKLKMENGFTDEAGVALAEALTVNTTLRVVELVDSVVLHNYQCAKATFGAQSYEAFSAMLRVNTGLVLNLPIFDGGACDERDFEHVTQMLIEQRLNEVGRGRLLASNQSTREEWVDALRELSENPADGLFEVNCLYSLLRLHPDVCMLQHNDATNKTGP
jgi:hypothetical protein